MDRGWVLSNERDPSGIEQVYVSRLNGSALACLMCGQPGPNGFPQERPQGDWILFCSWRGQSVTFGAPCLGGVGTDLYVMRPDGTHVTRLTAPGLAFEPVGVAADNYHPYWSPDGSRLVWTHVAFDPLARGGNAVDDARRRLREQLNLELYFLRVVGSGTTLNHPQVVHLTDNHPAWDEQAVFTPDMKDVVWMSSRGSPTWYQTFVTAAQQLGYEPPMQNETFGPMFVLAIRDPGFHTDLCELDLDTHATRRLTDLHSIIPEFTFDPGGQRLLWSEGWDGVTRVGRFALPSGARPVGPSVTPVAAWRGAPAQPAPTPAGVVGPPPPNSAAALPTAVVEGITLFQTQLGVLSQQLQGLPHGPGCCRSPTG